MRHSRAAPQQSFIGHGAWGNAVTLTRGPLARMKACTEPNITKGRPWTVCALRREAPKGCTAAVYHRASLLLWPKGCQAEPRHVLNNDITCNEQVITNVNKEHDNVYKWLCANQLSLNINKTKYMIFHNRGKKIDNIPRIQLRNILLEKVQTFSFLGVHINENLNWNHHYRYNIS